MRVTIKVVTIKSNFELKCSCLYKSTCISCALGYLYLDPARLIQITNLHIYLYDFLDIACKFIDNKLKQT